MNAVAPKAFYKFSFTQLIDKIESQFSDCVSLGEGTDPSKEVLQTSSNFSFAFPVGDIEACEFNAKTEKTEITLNFFRLGGADGPLPMPHVQEFLRRKQYERDGSAIDFLNLFTHRQISILYRALKSLEAGKHGEDVEKESFVKMMLRWIGFDQKQTRRRISFSPRMLLSYGNFFTQKRRSITGLEQLIGEFFKVNTRIEPFVGKFYDLPERKRASLGESNTTLGKNIPLGKEVWVQDARIYIHLGPLSYQKYNDFLPGREGYFALKDLVATYYSPVLEFDLKLHLKASEVPGIPLTKGKTPLILGQNTWLKPNARPDSSKVEVRHISGAWIRKDGKLVKR